MQRFELLRSSFDKQGKTSAYDAALFKWSPANLATGTLPDVLGWGMSAHSIGSMADKLTSTGSECDIRENFDTNECLNIFVSTKLHE